ncbi:MAG TPA: glycosyltransferase [Firmicutes bacterium]|nr:glycosyltransferase [Bacillota bacterium]
MLVILIGAGLLLFLYVSALFLLTAGVYRNRRNDEKASESLPLSVIVCARNEEQNIPHLLRAFKNVKDDFELILVDDRSADGTRRIMESFPGAVICHVSGQDGADNGKKQALECGIDAAQGEILLFTDADCVPPPGWIAGMKSLFSPKTDVVAGGALYEEKSLIHKALNLEMLAFAACAEGAFGWGIPLICTGNNLAYRKSLFRKAGGFRGIRHIRTGDDDLMVQRMGSLKDVSLRFAYSKNLFVKTRAQTGLKEFIQQRARWVSGVLHYPILTRLALGAVYFLYLLFFFSFFGLFFTEYPGLIMTGWGIAALAELIFLFYALKGYRRLKTLLWYGIIRVFFTLYILFIPLWALLKGYQWKE